MPKSFAGGKLEVSDSTNPPVHHTVPLMDQAAGALGREGAASRVVFPRARCFGVAVPIASARANIALVKYWGKRDVPLNLPETGSLSLTLAALETRTEVALTPSAAEDTLVLDGASAEEEARARVSRFLDLVRDRAGRTERASVKSDNTFPTAAGLASSASAFAALAKAAVDAYGLDTSDRELSILARRGSGSAARSVYGGFARMNAGSRPDGRDAFAEPVEAGLSLSAAIAVADAGPKAVGSTEGMERTRRTSPYHSAWVAQVDRDLETAQAALRQADFDRLASVVEGSCLAMHADAMAARPGVIYFRAATLWAIERVRSLRASGTPVCFTIDAGPHVVAFTPPEHLDRVAAALEEHPEIRSVLKSGPGGGVRSEGVG